MDEPIVYEFDNLPNITLDKNKLYILDSNRSEKDDLEIFINKTTVGLLKNNSNSVSFIWNPTQTSIYDINKHRIVKTFITCYNSKVGNLNQN